MFNPGMNRREFLKRVGLGGAALAGSAGLASRAAPQAAGMAKVVRVRDERLRGENAHQQTDVLSEVLAKGMQALTGKAGPDAWKVFFRPDDVVGVKVNCLFGPGASTYPEFTQVVVAGIISAGVKPGNIVVWDRTEGDLVKVGYQIVKAGDQPLCYGTDGDYEPQPTVNGTFNGRLSKILTQKITALVNLPILKDHRISGMTCAMKNHYGSFDNPGNHHQNGCNPHIADLNALPIIKHKTRLIICDCIRPIAHGGPMFSPKHVWDQSEVLFSTDPVALDAVGLQILEERRKAIGLPSLAEEKRPATYVASAAERGVGVADLNRIELVLA